MISPQEEQSERGSATLTYRSEFFTKNLDTDIDNTRTMPEQPNPEQSYDQSPSELRDNRGLHVSLLSLFEESCLMRRMPRVTASLFVRSKARRRTVWPCAKGVRREFYSVRCIIPGLA